MVMGYDSRAGLRVVLRVAPRTALLGLLLASCSGRDETWAIPETEDEPSAREEPAPELDEPDPTTTTGIAPLEDDEDEPITPTAPIDAGTTPDAEPPTVAFDCSTVPAAPVTFETHEGFTSSEDFVFDELGNYVGIDANGNLVRIAKTGEKELWFPRVAAAAGMAILPDGSVVICDTQEGALKRVYPSGAVSVVLGGLLYPNGVDIGPDGYIYVAENAGGRVRRVNPDTGEFSIVALGLHGPNGVAFTSDPSLLYVGSFEGSGVYKLELPAPGALGHASVFARPNGSNLREPIVACPDNQEGASCDTEWYGPGKCQALANVVDCLPVDRCADLPDGAECIYPSFGHCKEGHCVPPPNACDGLVEGAPCEDPAIGTGMCQSSLGGELYCGAPNPCYGLEAGAVCEDPYFGTGVCESDGGYLVCSVPDPCEGRSAGDACEAPFYGPGVCEVIDPGFPVPDFGFADPGAPPAQPPSESLYCTPVNPCEGADVGDACEDPYFGSGECASDGEYLYCNLVNVCEDLMPGAPCSDYYTPEGTCVLLGDGLFCQEPNACDGLTKGAPCVEPEYDGVCVDDSGYLYCAYPDVCDSLSEGDPCPSLYFTDGVCTEQDGRLLCTPPGACDGLEAGAACTDPSFGVVAGICTEDGGRLACVPVSPCDGLEAGAACADPNYGIVVGVCTDEDGFMYCLPVNVCDGQEPGAACTNPNVEVGAGVCAEYEGTLSCVSAVCVGLEDGASCEDPAVGLGQCFSGICMVGGPGGPGGIDGMGVDTCGNVYATEYTNGNVWRISPAGEVELLTVLPSGWIPNVKWGRDLGGFSSQVMYVADRDQGRLFGLAVGVPGATEFFAREP